MGRSLHYVLCNPHPIFCVSGMLSSITHRDEPSTDASLLRRACEGYEEGWQRLIHIYGPLVYGWIRKCGVQSADAADVMQETLLAVATALPKFDASPKQSCFRGWLWTIARNKLRDRQRRQANSPVSPRSIEQLDHTSPVEIQEEPPTDARADQRLVKLRALQCLQDLFPEKAWQMFWRTEIDGNDAASVAEELGVSKWAVYKAKARVLQRLRAELDGLE